MHLQLIRNATLRLTYAERLVLIDPYLAIKHTWDPLVGKSHNPLVDLPCPPHEVITDVELVIISHLHPDHFDPAAQELLPKDIPIFCQPGDEAYIQTKGFQSVTPLEQTMSWQGIILTRTVGQHGTGTWAEQMGRVAGFIFQAENEPTVYWAGDTIWCDLVQQAINDYQPDVIVTHSCGASFGESGPIVMDAAQTIAVCQAAPQAVVIATHMETFDFDTVSRAELRTLAEAAGIRREQLLIPADGERLTF